MLEAADELIGPVNDKSKLLASVAPEQVLTDTNDVTGAAGYQGGLPGWHLFDAARRLLCGCRGGSPDRAGIRADAGAAAGDPPWSGGACLDRDAVWCLIGLGTT